MTYNDWEAIITKLKEEERYLWLEFRASGNNTGSLEKDSDEWQRLAELYEPGHLVWGE